LCVPPRTEEVMALKLIRFFTILLLAILPSTVYADGEIEEKLYNFDDMLIDGAFRDPQGMFERARSEAEFEGALKLERSFMDGVQEDTLETSMRP